MNSKLAYLYKKTVLAISGPNSRHKKAMTVSANMRGNSCSVFKSIL